LVENYLGGDSVEEKSASNLETQVQSYIDESYAISDGSKTDVDDMELALSIARKGYDPNNPLHVHVFRQQIQGNLENDLNTELYTSWQELNVQDCEIPQDIGE
jgi:CDP-diacylglycerol pyrophosphatase